MFLRPAVGPVCGSQTVKAVFENNEVMEKEGNRLKQGGKVNEIECIEKEEEGRGEEIRLWFLSSQAP